VIYRRHTGSAPLDALESTHDKEPLDISWAGNIFSLDNCQPYQFTFIADIRNKERFCCIFQSLRNSSNAIFENLKTLFQLLISNHKEHEHPHDVAVNSAKQDDPPLSRQKVASVLASSAAGARVSPLTRESPSMESKPRISPMMACRFTTIPQKVADRQREYAANRFKTGEDRIFRFPMRLRE